jgi:(2Fe-2S) ferredoxin
VKRFLAALSMALAAAAQAMPAEISAEYRLTNYGLTIGHVNETFQRTGERYSIKSVTRSDGVLKAFLDDSVTLESRGVVDRDGLRPLEFEQRRAGNASRDVRAVFDWEKGVLRSTYRGETSDVPLPKATQDRISILYQFMNLDRAAKLVAMHMSNGRKVEVYTYRFVEEVRLQTPAGEFETFHYERVLDTGKEARTDVWLAKERFNLPVRVLFDDPRGLKIEQTILDLKVR